MKRPARFTRFTAESSQQGQSSMPPLVFCGFLKSILGQGLSGFWRFGITSLDAPPGLVVKRFNEKADCPCPYCHVAHRLVVVSRNYDNARLGRNGLEPLLDFEAAYTWHPDINHRESHRIAPGIREKTERLMKQLRLQADR